MTQYGGFLPCSTISFRWLYYRKSGMKTTLKKVANIREPLKENKWSYKKSWFTIKIAKIFKSNDTAHTAGFPFNSNISPSYHAVSYILPKNFKLLRNDSGTDTIFSQPPLNSFTRDKNLGSFLVRSTFQTNDQPGTFKCALLRCKLFPFIHNVDKISGPKRSIEITDHFTCTSANVIYCTTGTWCKKSYIGETGRQLGHRFREHLRDL